MLPTPTTMREKLIKIGAKVVHHARRGRLPLDIAKRGFRDSNQPCNHALAPVWRRRGQDSASGHWDGGLYCSLVVRGGHGQRANWKTSV